MYKFGNKFGELVKYKASQALSESLIIASSQEEPLSTEQIDNLYRYPFLTVGEDGYVNLYKNMNEAYQVDIREKVDISELECLDMLQDFKNRKLVVQLINGYQYEKQRWRSFIHLRRIAYSDNITWQDKWLS